RGHGGRRSFRCSSGWRWALRYWAIRRRPPGLIPKTINAASPMILSMAGSFVMLGVILVAVGVLFAAATIIGMAFSLMRPARMSAPRALVLLRRLTPGDLGIDFEELTFTVRDEHTGHPLKLPGWWMPHPN